MLALTLRKGSQSRENSDVDIANRVKISERLSNIADNSSQSLNLNLIAIDAVNRTSNLQFEKQALAAREEKNFSLHQNQLQNLIDHESYTLKRLISLLRLDLVTVELMTQSVSRAWSNQYIQIDHLLAGKDLLWLRAPPSDM